MSPEECLGTPASGNSTDQGSIFTLRDARNLALWLQHETAPQIAKCQCEIDICQFIPHFATKAAEGEDCISTEESGQQRWAQDFVLQSVVIGNRQIMADGDSLSATTVADPHGFNAARRSKIEHERSDGGDAGIGKMPQRKVRPAILDFRSGSEQVHDITAGILHRIVDEVHERIRRNVRKRDFSRQVIRVRIGPAVNDDDLAAIRPVLQDRRKRLFKLLAGAEAGNHDGEASHESPSMTSLGGSEARGGYE